MGRTDNPNEKYFEKAMRWKESCTSLAQLFDNYWMWMHFERRQVKSAGLRWNLCKVRFTFPPGGVRAKKFSDLHQSYLDTQYFSYYCLNSLDIACRVALDHVPRNQEIIGLNQATILNLLEKTGCLAAQLVGQNRLYCHIFGINVNIHSRNQERNKLRNLSAALGFYLMSLTIY